jgi:hypothetical protein
MIDHTSDFDNQFFRMVTVSLAKTMSKSIRWINYFTPIDSTSSGRFRVLLPFYTSLTGSERFIMDTFVDDITDVRLDMNTDQYQRGIITFNGFTTKSDEFANPNQYLAQKGNVNGIIKKVISKVKAVPISVNYDISIQLDTENEVDKCSQKILNLLFNYMFFNFDYYGIKIDAILKLPDDKTIEIQKEIGLDTDRKKTINFSLEVNTYYPIFTIDIDDLIVCDNDNLIDWDNLNVVKPSLDFTQTLKNYNMNNGQVSNVTTTFYSGDNGITWITGNTFDSGTTVITKNEKSIEGKGEINRVYWDTYYSEIDNIENLKKTRPNDPKYWNKYEFDNPIQPGKSKKDNDID